MKKNPMPLFLLTIFVVVVFGLLFTGCGLNQAEDGPATEAEAILLDQEPQIDERLAEIEAEQERLALEQARIEAREAALREERERAAAEAAAQPIVVTVPALTALEIDLDTDLSSETNLVGDPVSARIAQDVIVDGQVAIAAGSEIQGVVTNVVASRKFGGQAQLLLSFDRLIDPDAGETPIAAVLELNGQRQKKKDAATIGGAAAGGALLGRILNDNDRSEGTAVGAVIGGAIGTIVAAKNQADPVVLTAGTPLVVTLDAPVTIEI